MVSTSQNIIYIVLVRKVYFYLETPGLIKHELRSFVQLTDSDGIMDVCLILKGMESVIKTSL